MVAAHLAYHVESFRQFITLLPGKNLEDYLDAIYQGTEWASHVEIEILMCMFDRPILILAASGKITNPTDAQRFTGEPIFVYYNGHHHYDALLRKEGFNSRNIVQRLLTKSADLTAIERPASQSNEHFCQTNLQTKVAKFQNKENQTSLLHLACTYTHYPKLIDLLSEYKSNIEFQDVEGKTPLHTAAAYNNVEAMLFLLRAGASIEASDVLGRTPLHAAACQNAKWALKCLLALGASPNAKDKYGQTPLELACEMQASFAIQVLKSVQETKEQENKNSSLITQQIEKAKKIAETTNKNNKTNYLSCLIDKELYAYLTEQANNLNDRSISFYYQNAYSEAIKLFRQVEYLLHLTVREEKPTLNLANVKYNLGCIFSKIGQYATAKKYFIKAYGINAKLKKQSHLLMIEADAKIKECSQLIMAHKAQSNEGNVLSSDHNSGANNTNDNTIMPASSLKQDQTFFGKNKPIFSQPESPIVVPPAETSIALKQLLAIADKVVEGKIVKIIFTIHKDVENFQSTLFTWRLTNENITGSVRKIDQYNCIQKDNDNINNCYIILLNEDEYEKLQLSLNTNCERNVRKMVL